MFGQQKEHCWRSISRRTISDSRSAWHKNNIRQDTPASNYLTPVCSSQETRTTPITRARDLSLLTSVLVCEKPFPGAVCQTIYRRELAGVQVFFSFSVAFFRTTAFLFFCPLRPLLPGIVRKPHVKQRSLGSFLTKRVPSKNRPRLDQPIFCLFLFCLVLNIFFRRTPCIWNVMPNSQRRNFYTPTFPGVLLPPSSLVLHPWKACVFWTGPAHPARPPTHPACLAHPAHPAHFLSLVFFFDSSEKGPRIFLCTLFPSLCPLFFPLPKFFPFSLPFVQGLLRFLALCCAVSETQCRQTV